MKAEYYVALLSVYDNFFRPCPLSHFPLTLNFKKVLTMISFLLKLIRQKLLVLVIDQ